MTMRFNFIVISSLIIDLKECIFLYYQEISQNPQLFVGGASRFDVKQGELGEYICC